MGFGTVIVDQNISYTDLKALLRAWIQMAHPGSNETLPEGERVAEGERVDMCFTEDLPLASPSQPGSAEADDDRIQLHIEVCQASTSGAAPAEVESAVRRFLGTQSLSYLDGPVPLKRGRDAYLDTHVRSVCICDTTTERAASLGQRLLFWQARK